MSVLFPATGSGQFSATSIKVIRLVRYGCANRPFFHIVVAEKKRDQLECPIEQVGTYDPLPNEYNEKLVALNYERIRHWLGNGAICSPQLKVLLGLSGFYPIHPTSYITAWRNRQKAEEDATKEATENAEKAADTA